MKIGIVLYPTFGGSGVLATELGKALADEGVSVQVSHPDLRDKQAMAGTLTNLRRLCGYLAVQSAHHTLSI